VLAPAGAAHEAEAAPEERGLVEEDLTVNQVVARRGPFTLQVGALIQVQGAFYVGDEAAIVNSDPADTEGFRIRRARFGLAGTLLRHVGYYLAVDLKDTVTAALGGDLGTEILDAKIEWTRYPWAHLVVGLTKIPFSTFNLQSSSRLTLIERPLTTRLLAPEYRVGLGAEGQVFGLRYAAGLYNGSGGITSGNKLAGLAGVARLQYNLFGVPETFVPRAFRLVLGGAYMIDDGPAVLFHRVSGGVDVAFRRVRLLGEMLWQRSTPHGAPAGEPQAGEVARWGAAGDLSVFVYRGLVQLAARYEYFRDNDLLPTFGKQQLITAGANLYLHRDNLKLQVSYIRRDELTGPEIANDVGFAQLQAAF
jgi:phosphate-selective porin